VNFLRKKVRSPVAMQSVQIREMKLFGKEIVNKDIGGRSGSKTKRSNVVELCS
jgi:hypothetical protein